MRDMTSVIATVVFDETWSHARLMAKTLRKFSQKPLVVFLVDRPTHPASMMHSVLPPINEDHRIRLNAQALWDATRDRINRGVNDLAKALVFPMLQEKFGTKEVLCIDPDSLILGPLDDVFKLRGDLLMARERLDFYDQYMKAWECSCPEITLNAGVILFRKNCYRYWTSYYHQMCDWFDKDDEEHGEGQTVWNIVWQKNLGDADLLPQKYNQLHVKHGPHGAVVYHMAGMSQNMKLAVMESCYRQFIGEEP